MDNSDLLSFAYGINNRFCGTGSIHWFSRSSHLSNRRKRKQHQKIIYFGYAFRHRIDAYFQLVGSDFSQRKFADQYPYITHRCSNCDEYIIESIQIFLE